MHSKKNTSSGSSAWVEAKEKAIKLKKEEEKVIKVWEAENIKIEKARWGRFKIIHEKGFVELSKDSEPTKLSLPEVKKIISDNKSGKTKKKTK